MRKALPCILIAILLVSLSTAATLTPAWIPGDTNRDDRISGEELASAICSYMLGEPEALRIEDLRDAAYVYAYWNGEPRTSTDHFNRTVKVYKPVKKIVSLAPSNTEILFALGLGDKVVGVTIFCNYPPEAEGKEKVGGMTTVDVEKVISLNPDLVLGVSLNPEETVDKLDDFFPVFVTDHRKIKRIEDIFGSIERIGYIAGDEKNATALVVEMMAKMDEIMEKVNDEEKVNVTYIVWYYPVWVAGGGNFQNDVLEKAGGKNIFDDLEGWKPVDLEELIIRNPDVIIVGVGHGAAGRQPYDFIMNDERLKGINARKNGRVYPVDADIMSRPGPRIVEALEEVAEYLHPE